MVICSAPWIFKVFIDCPFEGVVAGVEIPAFAGMTRPVGGSWRVWRSRRSPG
jgi:hypothetical protein